MHVHEWEHKQEVPFWTRNHYCLDKDNCIVALEAKTSSKRWYVQNKKVVAVVKFEDENNKIQYQARYTNCYKKSEQKHAEDFFEQDIENGALREKVEVNPNGTITMYLSTLRFSRATSPQVLKEDQTLWPTKPVVKHLKMYLTTYCCQER